MQTHSRHLEMKQESRSDIDVETLKIIKYSSCVPKRLRVVVMLLLLLCVQRIIHTGRIVGKNISNTDGYKFYELKYFKPVSTAGTRI